MYLSFRKRASHQLSETQQSKHYEGEKLHKITDSLYADPTMTMISIDALS